MIKVVNKHWHKPTPDDIYIGRGSVLGNMWSHKQNTQATHIVNTREEAIQCYKQWLQTMIARKDKDVCRVLNEIYRRAITGRSVYLVCYCKPNPCHGDVIKNIVEEKVRERQKDFSPLLFQ